MRVFVQTLDDITLSFNVEPSDKIETLRLQIKNTIGLPPICQRLIFNGHKLDQFTTFSHYNIENEGLIHIVYRLRDRTANKST